jgi:hypothetical protein
MIIKITPETDAEKSRMHEVEHLGVQEFFMFLTKENNGNLIDAHDWTGGYKNLIGSLCYYLEVIKAEFMAKSSGKQNEIDIPVNIKNQFAKKGSIKGKDNRVEIIDTDQFKDVKGVQEAKAVPFNPAPEVIKEQDNSVEFKAVTQESPSAEDN